MNREELRQWAEREGIPLESRNLTNKGLENGKIDKNVMRRVQNEQEIIRKGIGEIGPDKKIDPREEAALKAKAQSEYARREFNRILASKETIKKDPSRWHELPRVELRDADMSQAGPNIILK